MIRLFPHIIVGFQLLTCIVGADDARADDVTVSTTPEPSPHHPVSTSTRQAETTRHAKEALAKAANRKTDATTDDLRHHRLVDRFQGVERSLTTTTHRVTTTTTKACGDSFCGDRTHAKIWIPIAAAAAGAATLAGVGGGIAAGVIAAQKQATKAGQHNETNVNAVQPAVPQSLEDNMAFHFLTTTAAAFAQAMPVGQSTPNVIQAPVATAPLVNPAFRPVGNEIVVRAASVAVGPPTSHPTISPAQVGSATFGWILTGMVVLGTCVLLALCACLVLCSNRKRMRAFSRHICPNDVEDSTDFSESSAASSMGGSHHIPRAAPYSLNGHDHWTAPLAAGTPRRPSASASDVEDSPLLPEGAALPKFWTWLKKW